MAIARDVSQQFKGVTLKTEGLAKASRALSKAGDYAEDQRDLMHRIGNLVVGEAKGLAPARSGDLRDAIRAGRGKTKAVVRAGFRRVPYAPVIHYGWADHNIEPQPYMLQALANKRSEAFAMYQDGMRALLFKAGLDVSQAGIIGSANDFTASYDNTRSGGTLTG
jgi:hypothetical protein